MSQPPTVNATAHLGQPAGINMLPPEILQEILVEVISAYITYTDAQPSSIVRVQRLINRTAAYNEWLKASRQASWSDFMATIIVNIYKATYPNLHEGLLTAFRTNTWINVEEIPRLDDVGDNDMRANVRKIHLKLMFEHNLYIRLTFREIESILRLFSNLLSIQTTIFVYGEQLPEEMKARLDN